MNKLTSSISRHRGTDFAAIIGFHIIVRLIVYPKTYFMYDTINYYMQYLDPIILRRDLLAGLRDLHIQPPLFNVFLGLILKLFPSNYPAAFSALYFAMGVGISCLSYLICIHLTNRRFVSVVTACAIASFPPLLQADRWLFYTYPITLLLLCACFFIIHIQKNTGMQTAFIAVCAAIVLTRSFFHLIVWLVPVMLLVLLPVVRFNRTALTRILVLCSLGWILSSVPYFRNYARYGMFTGSTFQGHNIAGMAAYISEKEITDMISKGRITPIVRIRRLSDPEVYYDYFNRKPKNGSEALDTAYKLTGEVNWNNEIYAIASKEYQRNTLEMIKEYPREYLKAVLNELYIFFGDESYRLFVGQHKWLKFRKDSAIHFISDAGSLVGIPLLMFGMYAAAISGFVLRISGNIRKGTTGEAIISRRCEIFMLFNLAYVLLTANLFELGEGCFMRIPIDPFLIIGTAVFITDYASGFAEKYRWNITSCEGHQETCGHKSTFMRLTAIAGIGLLAAGFWGWNIYEVFHGPKMPGTIHDESYRKAAEVYKQAVRNKPASAEAYCNLGAAYGELGRYDEAVKALKQAISIRPDYAMAYYNLSAAYNGLGYYNEAIEAGRQAIGIKPDYAGAHLNLGKAYLITGDSKSALNEYEILKELDGEAANKLFKLINR